MANNTVNTNTYAQNLGVKFGQSVIGQPKTFDDLQMRGRGFTVQPVPKIPIAQQVMRGRGANKDRGDNKSGGSVSLIDTSTKWTRRAAGFRENDDDLLFGSGPKIEYGSFSLNPIAQTTINWRYGAG